MASIVPRVTFMLIICLVDCQYCHTPFSMDIDTDCNAMFCHYFLVVILAYFLFYVHFHPATWSCFVNMQFGDALVELQDDMMMLPHFFKTLYQHDLFAGRYHRFGI